MSKYNVTIGLEMHCEMKSNAKVFSRAKNGFSELANSHISPLDLALPGTLPVVNKTCVEKALKMSLILHCKQPEYLYFDRKNYYYPDLPKGYQITQMHEPVGTGGYLLYDLDNKTYKALIHDIHLEEDSASLDHYSDCSLIDYNRAGIPLLELVTEPCFHSAEEAIAFLEEVKRIYQYTDISDADTKKGQIRCDVNVSISSDDTLGTKVEIKNVNSFSNVYEAINYEVKRQSELKDQNRYDEVEQETRRFDEETGTTIRMRSKVDAIDYKYFVEPNIPKYKITKEYLEKIKNTIGSLPRERKEKYLNEYNLSLYDTNIIIKEKEYSDYFEECISLGLNPKMVSNWLTGVIIAYLNKELISLKEFYLKPILLKQILTNLDNKTISIKQAKEIFNKSLENREEPNIYIKDTKQISDIDTLRPIIEKIINNNPNQVKLYHEGKSNLFDYFVGQVMKETKGKASPTLTKELISEYLGSK